MSHQQVLTMIVFPSDDQTTILPLLPLLPSNIGKVFKRGAISKKEDLNGIQPYTPFVFSIVAAGMSFAVWQVEWFDLRLPHYHYDFQQN